MSKRYYISDVIGDGSMDSPYRAKIQDGVINGIQSVITGKPDGSPLFSWVLCIVDADNHGILVPMTGVDQLPDILGNINALDLSVPARASIDNAISRVSAGVTISDQMSYDDIISDLGKALNSTFDVSKFRTQ